MLGIPYIESLFRAVLIESNVIKGRLHVCPKWGAELNTGNLDQVIEVTIGEGPARKYPLCILMPPRAVGDFTSDRGIRKEYRFMMLFLTTTYYTGANQVKTPNRDINKSTHSITDDWHDMERCAVNFMKVMADALNESDTAQPFSISELYPQGLDMVSTIGNDRLSGVLLSFTGLLSTGCDLEDYPSDYLTKIILPDAVDTHPEHLH